jgi:glutaredoxin/glutathione-dependent peroxiredoxin
MTISVGDRLPEATFLGRGEEGVEQVPSAAVFSGCRVVLFGLPGAFTPTCSSAHLPSFIRTADAFRAQGVDAICCVAVNDPHVLAAWAAATGADAAGIRMLSDATSAFTEAIGMRFDAPAAGYVGRSRRYAMLVEDGVVTRLNIEEGRGVCEISAGETLLAQLAGRGAPAGRGQD